MGAPRGNRNAAGSHRKRSGLKLNRNRSTAPRTGKFSIKGMRLQAKKDKRNYNRLMDSYYNSFK